MDRAPPSFLQTATTAVLIAALTAQPVWAQQKTTKPKGSLAVLDYLLNDQKELHEKRDKVKADLEKTSGEVQAASLQISALQPKKEESQAAAANAIAAAAAPAGGNNTLAGPLIADTSLNSRLKAATEIMASETLSNFGKAFSNSQAVANLKTAAEERVKKLRSELDKIEDDLHTLNIKIQAIDRSALVAELQAANDSDDDAVAAAADADKPDPDDKPRAAMNGDTLVALNSWKTLELRRDIVHSELVDQQDALAKVVEDAIKKEKQRDAARDKIFRRNQSEQERDAALSAYREADNHYHAAIRNRDDIAQRVKTLGDELKILDDEIPGAKKKVVAMLDGTGTKPENTADGNQPDPEDSPKSIAKAPPNFFPRPVADKIIRGHFAAHQVPEVRAIPSAGDLEGNFGDPAGLFRNGMPRLDEAPDGEKQPHVKRLTFAAPAHFPDWNYDRNGNSRGVEGLLINEGMELVYTADGQYEIRFETSAPQVPALLRLQFLLHTVKNGRVSTETLAVVPPIEVNPVNLIRGTSFMEQTKYAPRLVRHCGYSPTLQKHALKNSVISAVNGECIKDFEKNGLYLQRIGTARFGYGQISEFFASE